MLNCQSFLYFGLLSLENYAGDAMVRGPIPMINGPIPATAVENDLTPVAHNVKDYK